MDYWPCSDKPQLHATRSLHESPLLPSIHSSEINTASFCKPRSFLRDKTCTWTVKQCWELSCVSLICSSWTNLLTWTGAQHLKPEPNTTIITFQCYFYNSCPVSRAPLPPCLHGREKEKSTFEMINGSPCSSPPFSVNPHGAPPCSSASR